MANKRCFLCGHKEIDDHCSNSKCTRAISIFTDQNISQTTETNITEQTTQSD